jgi:hypothetical protein
MDTYPRAEGPSATAAEYIFPLQNGGIGVITDEAFGMGFLELSAPNGQKQQCSAPALAQRKSNSTNSSQPSYPSPISEDPMKLFVGSNSTNSTQQDPLNLFEGSNSTNSTQARNKKIKNKVTKAF